METIKLAEKLHGVLQGEGRYTGQKGIVIRVAGCPVKCPDCDSSHTWNTVIHEFDKKTFLREIKKAVKKFSTNRIILTGGEPGLYVPFLVDFFEEYQDTYNWFWEIETVGMHDWTDLYSWEDNIQFNFSPKIGALSSSLETEFVGFKVLPMEYIIKVVTSKETFEEDLIAIEKLKEVNGEIEDKNIYLMPKGIDRSTITRETKWLIKKVFKLPYNLSTRLHILLYNKKKLV